ncbi:MAG: hypothetical protein SGBAC_008840 [Bacillariaceae sp.]
MTSSSTCGPKELLRKLLIPLVVLLSFTLANFQSLTQEDLEPLDDPVPNTIPIGNSTELERINDGNRRSLILVQLNSTAEEERTVVNSTANEESTVVNSDTVKEETTIANNTANETSVIDSSRIPRRLMFTYPKNLLKVKTPQHLHKNVHRSIQIYGDAWGIQNKSNVDVLFLLDSDCIQLLEQVEPRVVPIFKGEKNGPYKADMCRLAGLYIHGGYYLDVDIEPVKALDPGPNVDFITAKMTNGLFFQAIMALSPGHPVLKSALESMILDWYMIPSIMSENNRTEFSYDFYQSDVYKEKRWQHIGGLGLNHDPKDILMGPMTLRLAFDRHRNVTTPWFLNEDENGKLKLYPDLVRPATKPNSWGCNYMVHDAENKTAYFYSRCRGTWLCPYEPTGINAMTTTKIRGLGTTKKKIFKFS